MMGASRWWGVARSCSSQAQGVGSQAAWGLSLGAGVLEPEKSEDMSTWEGSGRKEESKNGPGEEGVCE